MREHNEQCQALVGKDFALITVRRYESCTRYLAELIKLKYDKEDLPITEVSGELVRAFEFYLKTEKNYQQNTVIRYMKCLKKIINLALANEWIDKNPFAGIKFHEKEVVREFLTMEELMTIYQKEFAVPRLALVRDLFIFASFTGLAFIDVQQLAAEHIVQDNNGHYWIRKTRQKTNNMCNIPLLDIPLAILMSGHYYEKTELGTKAARSQLCINLVLRCYANRLNFSATIALKASFISFGKKERSINSNHFSFAFTNLLKIFSIILSSKPDACIEDTKSAFLILRFLPLRVSANSSVSSGITNAVDSIS